MRPRPHAALPPRSSRHPDGRIKGCAGSDCWDLCPRAGCHHAGRRDRCRPGGQDERYPRRESSCQNAGEHWALAWTRRCVHVAQPSTPRRPRHARPTRVPSTAARDRDHPYALTPTPPYEAKGAARARDGVSHHARVPSRIERETNDATAMSTTQRSRRRDRRLGGARTSSRATATRNGAPRLRCLRAGYRADGAAPPLRSRHPRTHEHAVRAPRRCS